MHIFKDKFGRNARLTNERLQHIITDHPEILEPINKIEETLLFPSTVIKNDYVKNLNKGEFVWKA